LSEWFIARRSFARLVHSAWHGENECFAGAGEIKTHAGWVGT